MATTAVDYAKQILEKISFADRIIFRKELRKAFRSLLPEERQELKEWFRSSCLCKLPDSDALVPIRIQRNSPGH